ncbi:glycerol-3-phosphate cytidylyltransferase (plasmid) [Roseobacteraceae bacterium NS-SX3]
MRRVITYGTFDTLHFGHIRLLRRARELGDYLIVALSTDEFNQLKGKQSKFSWEERKRDLEAVRYVDMVIPEENWEQKRLDVTRHNIDVFTMGDDWTGKFDFLSELCEVIYMPRTPEISSTMIRNKMQGLLPAAE